MHIEKSGRAQKCGQQFTKLFEVAIHMEYCTRETPIDLAKIYGGALWWCAPFLRYAAAGIYPQVVRTQEPESIILYEGAP